jgi:phage terminase large subunit
MKLNPALKGFWRTKADIKKLKGGRSSSKTHDAAGMAINLAANYSVTFLCLRAFQNKINDSVYKVLCNKIEEAGYQDEFTITNNSIVHNYTGSSFHFYGFNRNTAEIKGFEGADICWIEEAESLTKEQFEILDPTIRKEGAEIWILYNPQFVSDYVETNFKHDPDNGVIVRHINYDENPFLSETMRRKIERKKADDYEEYQHIYEGVPRTDDDKVVIKRSWIMAAIDAHKKLGIKPTGQRRVGYDVADAGEDANATVQTYGFLTEDCQTWKGAEDELLKSCGRVYSLADSLGASITYDSIGVGAGCGAKFKEINEKKYGTGRHENKHHVRYQGFNAGSRVENPDALYSDTDITNKDHFANIKAQKWWEIADRFRATYNAVVKGEPIDEDMLISISSDCSHLEELITELSTPYRDFDNNGRVKVESKADLAKRDIKSPNLADAFIEAYILFEEDSGMVFSSRRRR